MLDTGSAKVAVASLDGDRLGVVAVTAYDDVEIGECGSWQCCCGC